MLEEGEDWRNSSEGFDLRASTGVNLGWKVFENFIWPLKTKGVRPPSVGFFVWQVIMRQWTLMAGTVWRLEVHGSYVPAQGKSEIAKLHRTGDTSGRRKQESERGPSQSPQRVRSEAARAAGWPLLSDDRNRSSVSSASRWAAHASDNGAQTPLQAGLVFAAGCRWTDLSSGR
jgi:hypothetical protein